MQRTDTDHEHLARAIALAERGVGGVSPNPVVGAVLVKDDRVVGEGWHEEYGGPHAEVNAIAAAAGVDLRGATLYVSLEPCCHRQRRPDREGLGPRARHPARRGRAGRHGWWRARGPRAPAEPGVPQARPHGPPVGAVQ